MVGRWRLLAPLEGLVVVLVVVVVVVDDPQDLDGAEGGVPPALASGEGFGLQPLKLRLVDRARVQQLLGPGNLLGSVVSLVAATLRT